jgi:hypothetical protein
MDVDQRRIDELLAHPSESLNVEIKRWLNPRTPTGIAKIVKATQALRNRNGGFLVMGFDDKSLQPDSANRPDDSRTAFHIDAIQEIVTKYASERFEVKVAFGNREGNEYPVIMIPDGVTAPVANTRDLQDGDGAFLLREGDVYCRTLGANGRPSSSKARPDDWREIVNICFENREADFGRFLRRQLSGPMIEKLALALAPARTDTAAAISLQDRAEEVRRYGEQRFAQAAEARSLTEDERQLLSVGAWQVSLVIEPSATASADREFLSRALGANPQLTGWPTWLDSRNFSDELSRPKLVSKAWQALILSAGGWSVHADFLRLSPKGEFYLWRALQDDLTPSKVKPKTVLDPILAVLRVAEAIAVGLSVARALGWDETARLGYAFKWTKLSGRALESWANPLASVHPGFTAHDDEVESFVEVPNSTPLSAIGPYVEEGTRELFLVFDGYRFPTDAVEHWVRRLIERRL